MNVEETMIARARIAIFGWQPFYRRPVRRLLLAALDRFPSLAPDHWGLGDRPPAPLDRTRFTEESIGRGPMVAELLRRERPRWEALMSLNERAWMTARAAREDLSAMGPAVWFDLADALADALEPDLAYAHLDAELALLPAGERERRMIIDSGVTSGKDYYDRGPGGLGMRTWIGPRVLRQLGEDRVRSLPPPAVVRPTEWGGMRVDLMAEPWLAEPHTLADAFESAMAVLTPAGLFSRFIGFENQKPRWERSQSGDLGGDARESALGFRLDRDARAAGPMPGEPGPNPAPLLEAARSGSRVEDVTLSWADLSGADLRRLKSDELTLSWALLVDAGLEEARIEAGEFGSADLSRARLDGAELVSCNFARAIAPDTSWRGARIELTSLEHVVLTSADFSSAQLEEVCLDEAMLAGALFKGATIQQTSFRDAECQHVSFAGAVLNDVDFTDADLRGADFTGATLNGVDLKRARRE